MNYDVIIIGAGPVRDFLRLRTDKRTAGYEDFND